jgi:FlaA1/EpsC-like NDP-sugar epimerase
MSAVMGHNVLNPLIKLFHLAILCFTFLVTLAISSGSLTWPGFTEILVIRVKIANLILLLGYLGLSSGIFSACGLYRSHRLSHWKQRMYERLLAVSLVAGALLVLKWLFSLSFATNDFFPLFWLLTFCTLTLAHEMALHLLHLARLRGKNLRHVVIVGEEPDASALANRIRQETGLGYSVLRVIDTRGIIEDDWGGSDSETPIGDCPRAC